VCIYDACYFWNNKFIYFLLQRSAVDVIEKHQERLSYLMKEKTNAHIRQLNELDHTTSEALTQWEKDTKTYKDQVKNNHHP
jgi:hypothetical protein